jgi:hypothetical protein
MSAATPDVLEIESARSGTANINKPMCHDERFAIIIRSPRSISESWPVYMQLVHNSMFSLGAVMTVSTSFKSLKTGTGDEFQWTFTMTIQ